MAAKAKTKRRTPTNGTAAVHPLAARAKAIGEKRAELERVDLAPLQDDHLSNIQDDCEGAMREASGILDDDKAEVLGCALPAEVVTQIGADRAAIDKVWVAAQDRRDAFNVQRFHHLGLALLCSGRGISDPLCAQHMPLAVNPRPHSKAEIAALVMDAANAYNVMPLARGHNDHRQNDHRKNVPTDAAAIPLYRALATLLHWTDRAWWRADERRYLLVLGCYSFWCGEQCGGSGYGPYGFPLRLKEGRSVDMPAPPSMSMALQWPLRFDPTEDDRLYDRAARSIWQVARAGMEREAGRDELRRMAQMFGVSDTAAQNSAADAARNPVYKPGGWTKSAIVQHLNDAAESFSPSTFDTIRKRAGVDPAPKGGNGPHHCFSISELRKLKAEIDKGRYQRKADLSTALDELIERSTSKIESQSNHKL
jgi:hypothetical protein